MPTAYLSVGLALQSSAVRVVSPSRSQTEPLASRRLANQWQVGIVAGIEERPVYNDRKECYNANAEDRPCIMGDAREIDDERRHDDGDSGSREFFKGDDLGMLIKG